MNLLSRVALAGALIFAPTLAGATDVTPGIGPVSPGTAAPISIMQGCIYNSTLPTATSGQQLAEQCDPSGRQITSAVQSGIWNIGTISTLPSLPAGTNQIGHVIVDAAPTTTVTGTVTANAGTGTMAVSAASLPLPSGAAADATVAALEVSQGSTTSGQKGALLQGAVTTASPTYVTGQTSPISLDTTGAVRVNVTAGGGAGGTSSSFAAAFPATGTAMGAKNGSNMVNLVADASGNLQVGLVPGSAVVGKFGIDQTTPGTTNGVVIAPSSASGAGIAHVVSSALESSHVLKSGAGNLYSVAVTTGAAAGYLLIFNATAAPADGAVTPAACFQAASNFTTAVNYAPGPPSVYSTGITAVFSTTGCFAKTASATAFFDGAIQ